MLALNWPWLLLLLPLPWLLRRVLPPVSKQQPAALKVPFYAELTKISQQSSHSNSISRWQFFPAYLVWMLLVVAAADPQWLGMPVNLPQSGRDIMFAVDLSGSMQIPDMEINGQQVDRLSAIKVVASDFIKQRAGDRLGLILFGSKAYLQTPLTFDRTTVQAMLDDASIGLAGNETAVGDAIGLAIKHFQQSPLHNRVLILLTDGANNTGTVLPLDAVRLAAEQHIRIYTVGIGADTLTVPGLFSTQSINIADQLDVPTLQSIAQITGGMFFRAKDTVSLQHVYQALDKLEPVSSDQTLFRPATPLYVWPLAAAFIISLALALQRVARAYKTSTRTKKIRMRNLRTVKQGI